MPPNHLQIMTSLVGIPVVREEVTNMTKKAHTKTDSIQTVCIGGSRGRAGMPTLTVQIFSSSCIFSGKLKK